MCLCRRVYNLFKVNYWCTNWQSFSALPNMICNHLFLLGPYHSRKTLRNFRSVLICAILQKSLMPMQSDSMMQNLRRPKSNCYDEAMLFLSRPSHSHFTLVLLNQTHFRVFSTASAAVFLAVLGLWYIPFHLRWDF